MPRRSAAAADSVEALAVREKALGLPRSERQAVAEALTLPPTLRRVFVEALTDALIADLQADGVLPSIAPTPSEPSPR